MHDETATSYDPPRTPPDYLQLLVSGAPAEAFDGPTTPERVLALRLRAELEGRRRREAELTALIETAHDLAGLRDLDAVLRAIVQRARSLLGTEVAYLTLTDRERGDTYMRVTEGSVSARFQQLRLGMGEGLGGLVAQTARPYVTDDYFRDTRFQHTAPIDGGVREEGLVAILGVPLTLGGEVIGVIYAADRRARVFEREQIALLSSFAAHAAVAIDTTRLIAETRGALAALEATNETIERAGEVHDRLTALVLRGGGVDDVTAALSQVLGGRVEFTGPGTATKAVERSARAGHAVREAAGQPGGAGAGTGAGAGADAGAPWVAAVAAGGELLGALVLHGQPRLDPVDQRTLERAAMVTSLLLLARRSAAEAEQRVRGELLDDLLDTPGRSPEVLWQRAARLGADLGAPHVVLAALGPADADAPEDADAPDGGGAPESEGAARHGSGRGRLWAAASHLAATAHGLAAARDGGTVLLLPLPEGTDAGELARRAAAQLGAAVHAPVTVGASAVVAGPSGVPAAYAEARRCVDAMLLLGRGGEGGAAQDFGFLGVLLSDARDVGGFVERTLGPVLTYDRRRGTDLVETLAAYFDSGMSPVRAKDLLHVHVNTVAQRLDRVAKLLGDEWQSPERVLEVQLALRLHRLSGAFTGGR
ncbi:MULTISPECIES: helix-turn-helix domain-containing protein [unclassified Streptomyces]|uniref:helix-turn-helix domain-containing protein n=1 Tax=unclassified Streptomyces TaxID=2593676 RepID=UPI0022B6AD8B|nr:MULTISPECIES: GAF domain-containing protein [unclassified Streptomyces]MCZ7414993.1 GAF domain-containing protein [Streptomyces sp. WMMC897]MCZ7431936.1 GAF domain-containing protein [Streptomyces sp. WMMC1477]